MAIRFKKAFGLKADTMLRMQTAYDLAMVRAREREIVADRVAAYLPSFGHTEFIWPALRSQAPQQQRQPFPAKYRRMIFEEPIVLWR